MQLTIRHRKKTSEKTGIEWRVLLVFALFLYPVIINNRALFCYAIIYGVPIAYMLTHLRIVMSYTRRIPLSAGITILWIAICLLLSAGIPLIYGTYDFSYVNVVLAMGRKAIIVFFLFLVTDRYHDGNHIVEHFMLYFASATALYVVGSICFAIFSPLRQTWILFLHLDARTLSMFDSFGYISRFGWAGYSGYRNTIDCTLSVIFGLYLYISDSSRTITSSKNYLLIIELCLLGNLFYGRSGVVASALCVVVGLFLSRKVNYRLLLKVFLGIITISLVVFLLARFVPYFNDWYIWVSRPFRNLLRQGTFANYSADTVLGDMIFLPKLDTFIMGDGWHMDPGGRTYYMQTDVGFMRQILFWGIVPTFITYMLWMWGIVSLHRGKPLIMMLIIAGIVFETKGECYYEMLPIIVLFNIIQAGNNRLNYTSVTGFTRNTSRL